MKKITNIIVLFLASIAVNAQGFKATTQPDTLDDLSFVQVQDSFGTVGVYIKDLLSAGGSEWTDLGTVLHPTETGDSITIGGTTATHNFNVNGKTYFSDDVFFDPANSDVIIADWRNNGDQGRIYRSGNNLIIGNSVGSIYYRGGNNSRELILRSATNNDGNIIESEVDVQLKAGPSDTIEFNIDNVRVVTITSDTTVGVGTYSPNISSILDLVSTTKGFLPPRMTTTQRDAIGSPAEGLNVYNTTTDRNEFYDGTAWRQQPYILSGSATLDFPNTNNNTSSNLTITVTGAVAGDVVALGLPATIPAMGIFSARVSAANTVNVRFTNNSGAAIDPSSQTFNVKIIR